MRALLKGHPFMFRKIFLWAMLALCAGQPIAVAAADGPVARAAYTQSLQARAAAQAAASKLAPLNDSSVVVAGDSISANSNSYDLTTGGSNTWKTNGWYTMAIAHLGGRLRPVDIAGWPYTATGISSTGFGALLVANGGRNYSSNTTCSVAGGNGVSGATCTVTIAGGVVTNPLITSPGTGYLGQSPIITITDPSGTGSGAVILAQVAKAGQFASGGIGSAEAMAYLPLILNNGNPVARNVIFATGTNDNARGIAPAQSQANIAAFCRTLVAAGIRVFYAAPLERNGSAGAGAQKQAGALRRWAIANLATLVPGVVVLDLTPSGWIDPNLGSAAPVPAVNSADGLHPLAYGADILGKSGATQLSPYLPAAPLTTGTNADSYDATYNPQGNLATSALVSSSGTLATPNGTTEAPWTGTRMPGVFLSRVAGGTGTGTVAASIASRTDGRGGSYQVLTVNVTGAAAGEVYRISWSSNGTSATQDVAPGVGGATLQVGDRVVGALDEVVLSNVVNLSAVKLKLVAANASSGFPITPTGANIHSGILGTAAWGDYVDPLPAWNGDSLYLQTREMVIPTSTARLTMTLEFQAGSAGAFSFTAKLSGASLRRLN